MLYIFDRNENLITILKNDGNSCPYFEAVHTEKLTGENTFTFSVPADHLDCEYIQNGFFVASKDLDNNWQMFEILREEDTHEESKIRTFYCEHVFYELLYDFIEDKRPYDVSAHFALTQVLSGTRWSVGDVADFGTNSTNFYRESVLSTLQKIAGTWGGELRFRLVVEGGVVSARYVDLLPRRGAHTGKQFVYSKDIKSIKREVDLISVITAAYGYGKGVEVGEGYSRRITFADVEWSKDDGDPIDKPLGQTWVGDPEALQKWGRAGGTLHRFGVFDDSEEEDPAVLLQKTWEYLQQYKEPRITYELDVIDLERLTGYEHERVRLGDTVRIIDREFKPELLVEARVIEINRNLLKPEETKIVLGQFAPSIVDENMKLQETMQVVRDRQGVWNTGGFSGPVPTSWLDGIIDTLQNEVRAGNGSVTITDDNGIMIVDDPGNPTKALRLLGGLLAISNEKDPVTGDWVWRTFGTGDGFTADLLNAGQIRTSLVQILGNSNFYWDGDYLYIINPDDQNQQIRLSKEGIRFTKDGGQTWRVAMDFDGIRMEGQSQDGHTNYTGDGVKVYDEQGNLVGHLGSFETLSDQTATFTRDSVAYKQDGTQVAANVPRFEQGKFGQAIMVGEGTTNLVSNPSFESGMWPELWQSANGTATLVTGWNSSGNAARITITNEDSVFGILSARNISLAEGVTYTISFRARAIRDNFPIIYMYLVSFSVGSSMLPAINLGTAWQRYTITYTIPVGKTAPNYGLLIAIDSRHDDVYANDWIEVDDVQIEAKPYATSFIDGTRAAETLTIPTAGVLNPQEGMVEVTYIPSLDSSKVALGSAGQDWWWIFGAGSAPNTNELKLVYANGSWHFRVGGDSDTTYSMSFAAGDKISLALAWKQGVDARFFINGVKVATFAPSNFDVGTIISIGYSYLWNNSYCCNGLIDDLRISSRARTDEEILATYQSGQPLPVDEWTTWKSSFDGHLHNEVPVRKYGLLLKQGTIRFDAPSPDEGILIYDTQGNLRTHIGQYAAGKYGAKVINGEIYSTQFQTGEEGASDYIKLSSGYEPLLVVDGNKNALSIWAARDGGFIQFFDPSADDMRGQILPHDDLDGVGLRVHARNNYGGTMGLSLMGSDINMSGNVWVNNNLRVFGSKNAVVPTENYGLRALNVIEMPETKFMDEGVAELINGLCRVDLDPIFLETIEPNTPETPFIIHLTPYDWLTLRVKEIGDTYFIVEEKDGFSGKFAWQLTATRKGYAGRRLDRIDDEDVLTSNWEDDLNGFIEQEG